jgi:putative hydrolase of the HAD superfamily
MTSTRHIQAVTFDVGGTLIEPWPSVGHVYAQVAQQHGFKNAHPEILNRQFAAAWKGKREFDHSRMAWLGLVEKTFAGVLDVPIDPEFFDELYRRFAQPSAWRIFDDARPTLEWLREQGFRLGVISNWDERLRPLLERMRLSPFFESIVVSREVGFAKPSTKIFQKALECFDLPPHLVLHVGDSLAEDLEGAQTAGMQSLLLDRDERGSRTPALQSLSELRGLLERERLKDSGRELGP